MISQTCFKLCLEVWDINVQEAKIAILRVGILVEETELNENYPGRRQTSYHRGPNQVLHKINILRSQVSKTRVSWRREGRLRNGDLIWAWRKHRLWVEKVSQKHRKKKPTKLHCDCPMLLLKHPSSHLYVTLFFFFFNIVVTYQAPDCCFSFFFVHITT